MPKTLIRPVYENLLNEISAIYTSSQLHARRELNKILTKAYWDIGKRIVTVEQDHDFRAVYGDNLLSRLSRDLSEKHGNGFSETNLRYMRQYYIAYPIHQPADELDWTKQCLLLSIQDKHKRLKYKDLVISEGWSRQKLREKLKSENLSNRSKLRPTTYGVRPTKLTVHKGQLYTYKASPGESGYIYIDVGFSVTRQIKSWVTVEKGEVVQSRKSAKGFEIAGSRALPKDLYTYKAYLDRVIDGDTIRLHIDLGFDTFIKAKVRLRGINAPELSDPAGRKAKRYVSKALNQAGEIVVKTHYEDKYGRYLVDLWLDNEYLNQKLLDERLAVKY